MKRLFLLLLALTVGAETISAAGRAAEILERLAAEFRAMPGYGVDFAIEAGDYRAEGDYAVQGADYTLRLGDAEVYCDGEVRYEVDNERREVTIAEVDTTSRNLLNNPVQAFDFLGDDYRAELLSEAAGRAVIRLRSVAAEDASAAGSITVTVNTASMHPVQLDYDYDGEQVRVLIRRVERLAEPLVHFDAERFKGYEFIDFR